MRNESGQGPKKPRPWQRKHLTLRVEGRQLSLDYSQLMELTGCTRRSAHRYISDPDTLPDLTRRYLAYSAFKTLPHDDFAGFRIDDYGHLITPTGLSFSAGELEGFGLIKQLVSALERRNKELRTDVARLDEQVENFRARLGEPAAANDPY